MAGVYEVSAFPCSPNPIDVHNGDDLQAAIEAAADGTTLYIEPGTYGAIELAPRAGAGLTLRTSAHLPNRRIAPSDGALLFQVSAGTGGVSAVTIPPGTQGWTFIGMWTLPGFVGSPQIRIDGSEVTDPADSPTDLTFTQCLLIADAAGGKRGFEGNGANITVQRCYCAGFYYSDDAQAFAAWNGPGPFLIHDNYMEASGENVIFGGADAKNVNMLPANVTITNNYLTKPLAWFGLAGATIKNTLELKACLGAEIHGNVIENCWTSGQTGTLVLFTPRNQDGGATFTQVRDVNMSLNIIRHGGGGVQILGIDNHAPYSQITTNIKIFNNLFYDISWAWGVGRMFQIYDGPVGIEFYHNTCVDSFPYDGSSVGAFLALGTSLPAGIIEDFVFRDNVVPGGIYGVTGDDTAIGTPSVVAYSSGDSLFNMNFVMRWEFSDVVPYPEHTYVTEPGFVLEAQFRLPAANADPIYATDGVTLGCDIDAVMAATGVVL